MPTYTLIAASAADLGELLAIDDDASRLYREAGYDLDWPCDHPMCRAEAQRWRAAAEAGNVRLAVDERGNRAAFAAWGWVDRKPYLDQLSVRMHAMRKGLGSLLMEACRRWTLERGQRELWLTTYAHLPWNRPYYERFGFHVVDEADVGEEMREVLRQQRRYLPDPGERVAMRWVG